MHIHIETDGGPLSLCADRLRAALDQAGITGMEISKNADSAAFETAVAQADILFACCKPDLRELRVKAPKLDWIQVISAGIETLTPICPRVWR
ncbi:hypothetical protein [Thioclava sp. GXIMD2076]|uniref:Uncharacterized protein n=1 Tax=Thioclava kandeliae TaxID=3070818 RepID=A0ABV1SHG3_9RHOB